MKLVVFGPGHPFRGGIARTTTALVRALEGGGHDVAFLSARRQYPGWLYPGGDDRDPDACQPLACAERVLDPLNPLSWGPCRRRALELAADAWVIPYWSWAWAGLWWWLLRAPSRPPAIVVAHNPVDHDARLVQRLAARRVLGRCEGLFTHAELLAEELRRRFPGVPVASRPLGVEAPADPPPREDVRRQLGVGDRELVALFVGLIRPYKGVDLLLDAFSGLPTESPWRLVVAGEPWSDLGEDLLRKVAALEPAGRVRLELGWVAEARLDELMAAADLVVLPYRSGSQSAVAPEALVRGVPVLSTRVGGLAEVVRDGLNGRLVEPGSAPALRAALLGLDRAALDRLATGARESAATLSWSAYAAGLAGVVEELIRGR